MKLVRTLFISQSREPYAGLLKDLADADVVSSFSQYDDGVIEAVVAGRPDIYLLEVDGAEDPEELNALIRQLRQERNQPVIALVLRDLLPTLDNLPDVDDFVLSPYDGTEVLARVRRLLAQAGEEDSGDDIIKRDGLTVNLTTCEVRVDGAIIELTFKEYELLKLLSANPGRVYTREALLDKIWGYDYFGGDRTVDVHIRRLRSKIEVAGHTYIGTVRNIGYRFVPSA
jgi:two-component system alkaline phosphatase synthesis response regulator PhoP